VIGFQGGEYNQLGDYYTVRAYDAHAWSEVWMAQRGWVRVDPTAAVAPDRVRRSIQAAQGRIGEPVRFLGDRDSLIGTALRNLGMALDAAEVNWRTWVLGYSRDRQFGLMREFGLDFLFAGQWGLLTILSIFGVLTLIGLRLVLQGRVKQPLVVRLYRLFCRRMAHIGLPRKPSEGPLDYSLRTSRQRPDLAPEIIAITRLYIGLRYGARRTRPQRHAFVARVRRFRPRRLSGAG
jgi:protein-glutamine gamma-glutamyltransferase